MFACFGKVYWICYFRHHYNISDFDELVLKNGVIFSNFSKLKLLPKLYLIFCVVFDSLNNFSLHMRMSSCAKFAQ